MARWGRVSRGKVLAGLLLVLIVATGLSAAAVTLPIGDKDSTKDSSSGPAVVHPEVKPGAPWPSGAWVGGNSSTAAINTFGRWRAKPADTVTTYPAYDTWQQIIDSDWHVSNFKGFRGRLVYGLPLLPSKENATLTEVAAGDHDDVWRAVADTLVKRGRGDSFVRIGLEANGTWFKWGATADTAKDFVAAYRHVARVMAARAPHLRFVFDITCGAPLKGSDNRMASLEDLYPGDDVVDVVGCDFYDAWSTRIRSDSELASVEHPSAGPGLEDVVAFAKSHGKRFAVPEWGLTAVDAHGSGDNPYFIQVMYEFFYVNRRYLAFENYFDETDSYISSSISRDGQNPKSAARYRQLW
jgi:hypothetical protein